MRYRLKREAVLRVLIKHCNENKTCLLTAERLVCSFDHTSDEQHFMEMGDDKTLPYELYKKLRDYLHGGNE